MLIGRGGAIARQLGVLFESGAAGGASDGELLGRFVDRRDAAAEAAFEVLVRRHGPMVLRVCRGVLGDPHDAQDAFQATFLVLARKAGSIRKGDSLASWLHGVARRVAWRARAESGRRRALDRIGAELARGRPAAGDESERVELHDELGRLPEKYRAPLVLCYLEGLTHEEAAGRLHWPVGTVRSRLARGRDALRARLDARGVAAPAALLAIASASAGSARAATLPAALAESTTRAAMAPAAASAGAVALMKGALATMTRIKLAQSAALVFAAGLLAAGVSAARPPARPLDDQGKAAKADPAQSDLDKIQGTWYRVASEAGGKDWMPKDIDPRSPGLMVIFEGDQWKGVGDDGKPTEAQHTVHLTPTVSPKQIVLSSPPGKSGGIYRGIYKIEGDTLTLCLQFNSEKALPDDFTTKPDDGRVLDVYRRTLRPAKGDAPPKGPALSGTVVDPDGKPADGAEVLLTDGYIPLDENGRPMPTPGKEHHHARGPILRGRGRTDAEGRFRFEIRGEPIEESDRVILWAYRPGALATSTEIKRESLGKGEPIRVELEPPSETEFTVLGPDDNPVAGARIVPTNLSRNHLSVPEALRELIAATTDAEGKATIAALRPEEIRTIRVTAPRLGMQQWSDREFGQGDGPKLVSLLPVGRLKGRVTDADGKPAARLRMLVATIPETIPVPYVGVVERATDAEGRLDVPILPEGRLVIFIQSSEQDDPGRFVPLDNVRIEGDETTEIEFSTDQALPPANP